MARPSRPQWVPRAYARRRHRTWMRAMLLATAGWGVWWLQALLYRFAPDLAPSPLVPAAIGCACGALGLLYALWSVRGQRTWILFTLAPIFANGTLLVFPWIVWELLPE